MSASAVKSMVCSAPRSLSLASASGLWPVAITRVAEIGVVVAHDWRRVVPHLPNRIVCVPPSEAKFASRARRRLIGRWIFLSRVRATPSAIVGAAQRFTDVPVRYS